MVLLLALLLAEPSIVGTPVSGVYVESCVATEFANDDDKLAGGVAPFLGRRVRSTDNGVAHRTLPLGTEIEITNPRTGKATTSYVVDRGPFGRARKNGTWYNGAPFYRKLLRAGKPIPTQGWRGCLDMTRKVRLRLRHNGRELVHLRVTRWPRTRTTS